MAFRRKRKDKDKDPREEDSSLFEPNDWSDFGQVKKENMETFKTWKLDDPLNKEETQTHKRSNSLRSQSSFHTAFESERDMNKPPPPQRPPQTITINKAPQSQQSLHDSTTSLQSIGMSQSPLKTVKEEEEETKPVDVPSYPLTAKKYKQWVKYWQKYGGKNGKPKLYPECKAAALTPIPSELKCEKDSKELKHYKCRIWEGMDSCPDYKAKDRSFLASFEETLYQKQHKKKYQKLQLIQNRICQYYRDCGQEVDKAYVDDYGDYEDDGGFYGLYDINDADVYRGIDYGHHVTTDIYAFMLVMVFVICFVCGLCCGVISGWIWCQRGIHRRKREELQDISEMTSI